MAGSVQFLMRDYLSMPELPTGTVTFLFTDIEGSTRLIHEYGDQYAELLAEHRRRLREVFARNEGVEVDTQGDSFFVAFARAADAVRAAADAQEALSGEPVRVRIGIHTGTPLSPPRDMWAPTSTSRRGSWLRDTAARYSYLKRRSTWRQTSQACVTWASIG